MLRSSSRWLACSAGAAFDSGRMLPSHVVNLSAIRLRARGQLTFDKCFSVSPLLQALLETVGRALPLKLDLGALQRGCRIGVEQDMTVFQVLSFRSVLQMLLKGVAAVETFTVDWGDGGFVDGLRGFDGGCFRRGRHLEQRRKAEWVPKFEGVS